MWKYALPRVMVPYGPHRRYHHWYSYSSAGSSSSSSRLILRPRHVPLLFAMATIATLHQPVLSEAAVAVKEPLMVEEHQRSKDYPSATNLQECFWYGCPLLPQDIFFNDKVRQALETIRPLTRQSINQSQDPKTRDAMEVLQACGNDDTATLTLIGYKGGPIEKQINQDRAFALSPFRLQEIGAEEEDPVCETDASLMSNRLLGVFDGHAPLGEAVSQFATAELPRLLASKLNAVTESQDQENSVKKILVETFVELDKSAPAQVSGGCTASVVLQLGPKVYVANAGDSRSFLVVYHKLSKSTEIVFISREDKPDLPEERARVEAMGGQVYIPARPGAASRVLYSDPDTGHQSGLAMSRSLGDWVVGKLGVIPDPIVDVIDIPELVQARLDSSPSKSGENVNGQSKEADDVCIFAVSASDGIMDYVDADMVASVLAASLFEDDSQHPLSACERLISIAANRWQDAKKGRYRDDISISVSKLRIPPS